MPTERKLLEAEPLELIYVLSDSNGNSADVHLIAKAELQRRSDIQQAEVARAQIRSC